MRTSAVLSLLCAFAAGCTEAPEADELLHEDGAGFTYDGTRIPDGVRIEAAPDVPEPAFTGERPRVVVTRYDRSRVEDGIADGTAMCPFEVTSVGLPAIDASGEVVATLVTEVLSSSDGEDELATFRRQRVADDREVETTVVLDGDDAPGRYHCWTLYKRARAHAAAINETLDEGGYRPMERFPVALTEGWAQDPFFDVDPEARSTPHNRPVEVSMIHGDVVLRIPGVKVFARGPAVGWGDPAVYDPEEDACWFEPPYVAEAFVDETTGVVLLRTEQSGGPCFCYAPAEHHAWSVDREAIASILAWNEPLMLREE
jgi:hypothetical protein